MGGRPCSICSHPSRAALDGRLAAGESFHRVATAFNVSESALKRHKAAGHVQEAQQAHAEAQASARSTLERVKEMDERIAELSFGGGTLDQMKAVRDYGIHLMRRAQTRGDDRGAIAALASIQRSLEAIAEKEREEQAGDADANACPAVIVYPATGSFAEGPPEWLTRQLPGVKDWLPDNGRGDSMTFAGERDDSPPDAVL